MEQIKEPDFDYFKLDEQSLEYIHNCANLAYESDKDTWHFVGMANPKLLMHMVAKIRELRSYLEIEGIGHWEFK